MSIRFNAEEIYEMAETIERNGAKFYAEAAVKATDENVKTMLLDMAKMEEEQRVRLSSYIEDAG